MRTLTWLMAGLLLLGPALQTVNAQQQNDKQAPSIDRLKIEVAKLGTGDKARATITTKDGVKTKGYVFRAGDDDFVMRDRKTDVPTTIRYADVVDFGSWNPDLISSSLDFGSWNPDLIGSNPDFGSWNLDLISSNPDFGSWNPDLISSNPDFGSWNPDLISSSLDFGSWNPDLISSSLDLGSSGLDLNELDPDRGL